MPKRQKFMVRKREGNLVLFDEGKVVNAIYKAFLAVGDDNRELAEQIAEKVIVEIKQRFRHTCHVEDVQDAVEKVLIKHGLNKSAKAFILYREKRKELREYKEAILGRKIKTNLSLNALQLLKERYLLRDSQGKVIEAPEELFWRVAKHLAAAEKKFGYGKRAGRDSISMAKAFFHVMNNLDFLPGTPILMNTGTNVQQLASCFVLPIEDSIPGIFEAVKQAAIIHQSGAGTGFAIHHIRPRNTRVSTTQGYASGPVSFLKVFDTATGVMKQGSKRRGANIAVMRIDHPDILDFITVKDDEQMLQNFNLSVGLTDRFMRAAKRNKLYPIIDPRTGKTIKKIPAADLLGLIAVQAWKDGDPGVLFLDTINKHNPLKMLGRLEATSPCAEMPLLPYEAGFLGSINLATMVHNGSLNELKLEITARLAVRMLDNALELCRYPLPQTEAIVKANRKLGIGVMGFADMLYQLGVPYNSNGSIALAHKVMRIIMAAAQHASAELARQRGVFSNHAKSSWKKKGKRLRNATLTAIAPTGSISIIADSSASIEPNIALCYTKKVLGKEFFIVNKYFEQELRKEGLYSEPLLQKLKNKATIQDMKELSPHLRRVFVLAHDIAPQWHIKVQAAFQKYTDNGISKTVNFPRAATVQEIEKAYILAHASGCKGITIYRDQSKVDQIFSLE